MSDPIYERLSTLAVARFGDKAKSLAKDTDLFEALGINSLQAMDLLTDLEEAFGVEVPDYELTGVHTLSGLADVVRGRL
jgi:acyl carrier protein